MSRASAVKTINPWLVNYKPATRPRLRLFCFHHAGGGAHAYGNWADGLPPACELFAIQSPGRGARMFETPFEALQPLIRALTPAILPYLNQPFAFFGHSMGALVSFELARHLRSEYGIRPLHLFVSGSSAPSKRQLEYPLSTLPDDELKQELARLDEQPKEALENEELMRMMLPAIRADFKLCEQYLYTVEPPLACPITAYGGLGDESVTAERLEAWREETCASFTRSMFPGGHFFLQDDWARSLLIQSISRHMIGAA
jgi:medium-chain acyl-[acyl-carrier-protein] hydrolase